LGAVTDDVAYVTPAGAGWFADDVTADSFTIGANTLGTAEWGYLDDIDQGLKTTDNATFASISGANVTSGADPGHTHTAYAPTANGVTNGDNHDHAGGDGAQIDHGGLAGLTDDDHVGYARLAGRAGGQTLIGGSAVTDILKLQGTSGNGTLTSPAIQGLVGNNGATVAYTVLNNGYFGLGTALPNYPLTVQIQSPQEGAFVVKKGDGVNNALLSFGIDSVSAYFQSSKIGTATARRLSFWDATAERFSLIQGGNIGIETTSPGAKLQVNTVAATTIGQIIKGAAAQSADYLQILDSTGAKVFSVENDGDVVLCEGADLNFGTTTGSLIGATASQKLGLWGTAPIVQPTTGITAATFAANTSGIVDDTATWDGYTVGQVVKALRTVGLLQ